MVFFLARRILFFLLVYLHTIFSDIKYLCYDNVIVFFFTWRPDYMFGRLLRIGQFLSWAENSNDGMLRCTSYTPRRIIKHDKTDMQMWRICFLYGVWLVSSFGIYTKIYITTNRQKNMHQNAICVLMKLFSDTEHLVEKFTPHISATLVPSKYCKTENHFIHLILNVQFKLGVSREHWIPFRGRFFSLVRAIVLVCKTQSCML